MNAKRVAKKKAIKEDDATIGIKEIFAIRLRTLANEINDWKTFKDKTGLSSADIWRHMRATGNPTTKTIATVARRFGMSDFEFLFLERPEFFKSLDQLQKQIRTEDSSFPFDVFVKPLPKEEVRKTSPKKPKK
jgi:DNA-binding phage protein